MQSKGFSLRYKLLLALTVFPVIGLSLFLIIAKNVFEADKRAYIHESSLSVSKTRAARVNSEIVSVMSSSKAIVLSYQRDSKSLASAGTQYFDSAEKLEAFQVFEYVPKKRGWERTINLAKESARLPMEAEEELLAKLVSSAYRAGMVVKRASATQDKMLIAARFGELRDPRHLVTVALFEANELSHVFNEKGPYVGFLAKRQDGRPVFLSGASFGPEFGPEAIWSKIEDKKRPEGTEELKSPDGQEFFASFSAVGLADLVVVSVVSGKDALAAVEELVHKAGLFFIAIFSFMVMIAVVASRGLTSSLRRLSFASQKIAGGDFDVRVDSNSTDEIGVLARSFNAMASEVSRLMKETAQTARMEAELATAKTVQETLFPEPNVQIGPVQISGVYLPATECGGDWWFYSVNGSKVYVWIGDATGHGAPAALLTSAARAVASVLNFGAELSAADCLNILNRAIWDTSKGQLMMTFFLACIDQKTGEMTYANASHEPPLLLKGRAAAQAPPRREDFIPLNAVNNPRVGEKSNTAFVQSTVQLAKGDRIVFYTDGVVDMKNSEDKAWGEREFLKTLSSQMSDNHETSRSLDGVVKRMQDFRGEKPLEDDVTLVMCKFKGAA